jgi:phage protein D
MTNPLFTSSAPVFEVEGEVRGELARDLVRLEVAEGTDGLKTLTARFLAFGPAPASAEERLLYLDGRIFDFGKELAVILGPAHAARTVFRGKVSALEADFSEGREPEVVIFAEDALMSLRMTRRTRTYERMSDADIASEVASLHGLSCEADAEGPTYDRVQQWNVSDLAFLRERARLIQAEVWVRDRTLCFQNRSRRSAPAVTLVMGNELLALTVRADLAHQRTSVRVTGYDASDCSAIDEEAGSDAIQAEVSAGRTGPSVLRASFGERASHRAQEAPLAPGEAREWARAEMLRRCRGFVQASGTTSGTPDLTVGSRIELLRVGAPFEGRGYYATRVRHTYDLGQGYRTCFDAERPTVEGGP